MGLYVISARAYRDLYDIGARVAEDDPAAAVRLVRELRRHCQLLADNVHVGWPRPRYPGRGTRSWPAVEPYLIVHWPIRGGVRIVRILDGRNRRRVGCRRDGDSSPRSPTQLAFRLLASYQSSTSRTALRNRSSVMRSARRGDGV